MALKSSGITRPADLKGKKVGYPGIEWDELMLAAMLEADGLTLDDVELHDVGYALSQVLAAGDDGCRDRGILVVRIVCA